MLQEVRFLFQIRIKKKNSHKLQHYVSVNANLRNRQSNRIMDLYFEFDSFFISFLRSKCEMNFRIYVDCNVYNDYIMNVF